MEMDVIFIVVMVVVGHYGRCRVMVVAVVT